MKHEHILCPHCLKVLHDHNQQTAYDEGLEQGKKRGREEAAALYAKHLSNEVVKTITAEAFRAFLIMSKAKKEKKK